MKTKDGLPGSDFYSVFSNRNNDLYKKIAGDLIIQKVCNEEKYRNVKIKIFNEGMKLLYDDLQNRFPDQESVKYFFMEVDIYKDI